MNHFVEQISCETHEPKVGREKIEKSRKKYKNCHSFHFVISSNLFSHFGFDFSGEKSFKKEVCTPIGNKLL